MAYTGSEQVVTHQVTSVSTVNVVVPHANSRQWSTGLCGCFEDVVSCLCGCFCLCCLAIKVSGRLNESCCVPCLPGGTLALRTKLRTTYGIDGTICNDCLAVACCEPLVYCQMDRELTAVGVP